MISISVGCRKGDEMRECAYICVMSDKDSRFATVRILIEQGHIREFRKIFDHIPRTVVAKSLRTHPVRFNRLVDHIDQFPLKELILLAELIGVDARLLIDLAYEQSQIDAANKGV